MRQVFAGFAGTLLAGAQRISPDLVDWYLQGPGRIVDNQKTDRPDVDTDNLYQPSRGPGRTTGQFGQRSKSTSLYTRWFGLHPARRRIVAGAALAAGIVAALRSAGTRR